MRYAHVNAAHAVIAGGSDHGLGDLAANYHRVGGPYAIDAHEDG